jgi:hypothetical protein
MRQTLSSAVIEYRTALAFSLLTFFYVATLLLHVCSCALITGSLLRVLLLSLLCAGQPSPSS